MTTRRHALITFAGLAAPAFVTCARAAPYTVATAPDALTKAILGERITPVHKRLVPGADFAAIIREAIPTIIERNFARLNGPGVAALLGGFSRGELRSLANTYAEALDGSRPGRLLDLLALRLRGRQLARLSPYFGFAPMYEASWRSAPEKTQEFLEHANPNDVAPVPEAVYSPIKKVRYVTGGRFIKTFTPNLDMTLRQIYTGFRTSVVGGLSVKAALYETTVYASRPIIMTWGGAYFVGTGVSMLIQEFAPSLHMAIGAGIHTSVDTLTSTATYGNIIAGAAQAHCATSFSLGSVATTIAETGGDYGICSAWYFSTGGGSGGSCSKTGTCPVFEAF